jgi:hypothetical protein
MGEDSKATRHMGINTLSSFAMCMGQSKEALMTRLGGKERKKKFYL